MANDLTRNQEIQSDTKGIVFNIQHYSIQDGPGIRTTVFLKGCPLRCAWCSNPESQSYEPEVMHRNSLCKKCGHCIDACPEKAITLHDNGPSINRMLCNNCSKCAGVCTTGALKVFGEKLSAREVFEKIKKDAEFYRNSEGGVTVSGGEALSQPDFVAALFKLCQDKGIHTCIETSGFATIEALEKVLPYTSLWLFDIKLSDLAAHRKWTGRPNDEILRNLRVVVSRGSDLIIRVPLIPGINDSVEEQKNIASIAVAYLKKPRKVNLLPYHRFAMGKYQMLDRQYQLPELITQKDPEIQKLKQLFESFGLECEIVL